MRLLSLTIMSTLVVGCQNASADADSQNGKVLFAAQCVSCHVDKGLAGPVHWDSLKASKSEADITEIILSGLPDRGMPAFGDALNGSQINDILAYVKQQDDPDLITIPPITDVIDRSGEVTVETFVDNISAPWGLAFLPHDQGLLFTEISGQLKRATADNIIEITGLPEVQYGGQGGLLDVAIDPDYAETGWVYLSFSEPLYAGARKAMTTLIRGKITDDKWRDEEVIFKAKSDHYIGTPIHYGSRITFDDDGHVFLSIGDRFKRDQAQDITRPNGKIHRLNKDGSIPADNPFVKDEKAYASIYSYGHRNPQGLIFHPETQQLWSTEHGPKGGDELNLIKRGDNYGWPVISHGRNYSGTELTPFTAKAGMRQPVSHWTPSIAVCGLDVYQGSLFPEWQGRLMVGALKYQQLRIVDVTDGQYQGEEIILNQQGRVRDVTTGPDGAIYVALPEKIVRLTPKKGE